MCGGMHRLTSKSEDPSQREKERRLKKEGEEETDRMREMLFCL